MVCQKTNLAYLALTVISLVAHFGTMQIRILLLAFYITGFCCHCTVFP